jgi:hypothetical protein
MNYLLENCITRNEFQSKFLKLTCIYACAPAELEKNCMFRYFISQRLLVTMKLLQMIIR